MPTKRKRLATFPADMLYVEELEDYLTYLASGFRPFGLVLVHNRVHAT
jgi:hypothetical protein